MRSTALPKARHGPVRPREEATADHNVRLGWHLLRVRMSADTDDAAPPVIFWPARTETVNTHTVLDFYVAAKALWQKRGFSALAP